MSLGSQVRKYRLLLGWTLEDLENRSGVARGTISALENRGSNKSDYSGDLARAFGLTIEQLADESKNWLDKANQAPAQFDGTLSHGPDLRGRVPLISWVQAGDWCEAIDNFQPGDAEEWLACPRAHGPHTFALRVRGVSMEPKYRDGAVIYVDPDRAADHLSNVVVRIEGEAEVTFKQLVVEGSKRFLRPLNPDWPGQKLIEIGSQATICGVVIGQFIED